MCIGGTSGQGDDSVVCPSEYRAGMMRSGATDPAITPTTPSVFPVALISSSPSASISWRLSFCYEFVSRRQPFKQLIWTIPSVTLFGQIITLVYM